MRKNLKSILLMLSLVSCFALTAFGQETTGEIQGTITDQQGAVVPNVAITIRGVDVGFTRTIQTDSNGFYRAQQVPPGTYRVSTAAVSGFVEQVRENVQVALGNATTLDFTLGATVGAVVDVNVDSGVIVDPTETKAQDNISSREIESLPKGTGFSSLLRTTAAVRPEPLSGQFSINGATGPENSFIIDGQETQNYKNGLLNSNNDVPFQAIQEIQVKSSGFEAEFGGATGGVINAVTKSGSNQFHGEFGAQFVTNRFNAGRRSIPNTQLITVPNGSGQAFEFFPQARDEGHSFFPTALLSGPIIKDRLWFFGIHSPRYVTATRTTNFITGFGATRAPATIPAAIAGASTTQTATAKTTINYSQFRLDASPFNSLRISSSYTWNPVVDEGLLLGGSFVVGAPGFAVINGQTFQGANLAALQGGRQNSNNIRVEGNYTPTGKLVVTGRYTRGFLNQKLGSYGIPNEPRIVCQQVPTAALATLAGCAQGFQSVRNNDLISRDVSLRTTIDANASYLIDDFAGRHEVKGGYQNSKILNDVSTGSIGPGRAYLYYGQNCFDPDFTYVQWHITPGNYTCPANSIGTGVNYQFGAFGKATNTANTFFVQDKWQPTNRLTFNLGVRFEKEEIPSFLEGNEPITFGYGSKIAPRLGVAYALTGDGKTKVSAFYGRFFDRLKFSLPQGSFGGQFYHVSYFYITADRPGYQNYSVAQNAGSYNFPGGGQCPITSGSRYVCDQDYRIPSNAAGGDLFETGAVDPDIKPYRQSEFTAEFQREVFRSTVFTARYLRRNLDRVIEDAGVPTASGSEAYIIGNPGEGLHAETLKTLGYGAGIKPVRKYNALQLEMDSRFVNNFSLNLNYTLSRLYGNYSGLAGPDEISAVGGSRNDPNVLRDFDLPQVGYTASGEEALGILPLDRTHVFKASGTYSFDWMGSKANSTDLSFFTTAQSGTPLTTFVSVFGIPIPETKRGDLGRTEMFTQTDLNLQHRYRFGRDDRFSLVGEFNVLNVFNENKVLAVNQNKHSGYFGFSYTNVASTFVAAQNRLVNGGVLAQYAAAETAFSGGTIRARNAAFNTPVAFQDPRAIRFGFRFLF